MMCMRILLVSVLFITACARSFAQDSTVYDFFSDIKNHDLSGAILPDSVTNIYGERFNRGEILGFIGAEYQRFQIHISSIKKCETDPYVYHIEGKTKVVDNICSFTGTITIIDASLSDTNIDSDLGVTRMKVGQLKEIVSINESRTDKNPGYITGDMTTNIYIDSSGNVQYDALINYSDSYANNQFRGSRKSYYTRLIRKVNWGDRRIPDSGDLDIGAGYFSVNDIYENNGWKTYQLSTMGCESDEAIEAKQKENEEWWK